jgi:crotonobetainyl-CoA:carnitine CoA-transferase CaiB-like acyl-CoA transferase
MPGPLAGVKVLDLSQLVSGPFATMLLADQGAEVIKVEPITGLGDVTRAPNFARGGFSAFYLNNNRGKRCLALDITSDAGREIMLELAGESEVLVQNFRPGVVERLGIGYESVKALNNEIVYCSVSGFGPTGPYSGRPVLDSVIQGLIGMISRQFNPEIPFPDLVRNIIADKSTALTAAQAITAALLAKEKGQGGQHIEVPMLDAAMNFFWPDGMVDKTMLAEDASSGITMASVYNLTECADGKIIYFVASDPQRHGLYRALGHPEWIEDPRFRDMVATSNPENFAALGVLLAEALATISVTDALDRLTSADVPCGPVLDADEALADPQLLHNETLQIWEHPLAGSIRQPRPAARFSATPAELAATASLRGEDNDAILGELGRSAEDIACLRDAGIIT